MPRHDLDAFSLMAGILFSGVAAAALVDQGLDLPSRWVLPVLLIIVGVAGLLATAFRQRSRSD